MNRPIVTIVIPAFNAESTIEHTVRSALNQTESAIEVVVIDDGSTDTTGSIVRAIPDKRLRVAYQENAGPSRARNHGISLARGEWIGLLDADDVWGPTRAADLLSSTPDGAPDLIGDDLIFIDEAGNRQGTFFEMIGLDISSPTEVDVASYLRGEIAGASRYELANATVGSWVPGPGMLKPLIRRSFLERHGILYPEDIRGPEDYFFYCACLLAGARFVLVPTAQYIYVRRSGSLSVANLPELHRHRARTFERLMHDPRVPASARASLQERHAAARRMASYEELRAAIRNQKIPGAIRVALSDPTALRTTVHRTVTRVRGRLRLRTRARALMRRERRGGAG